MIKDDISLTPCTALRVLTLAGINPSCDAIAMFLSEVSSPYIRKIVFPFTSTQDIVSLPDFTPLAASLAGRNLAGVGTVSFLYSGPLERHLVLAKICRDLPAVAVRGVIEVVVA